MTFWPLAYDTRAVPTRFGTTHVVVSGPANAPPLVLLHGYMVTLNMWAPNVAEYAKSRRIYAIDIMGQPGKSLPAAPITDIADFVAWLGETLDGLGLDRVTLLGMSFGGWLSLHFAIAAPARVDKLALLSPAGLLPFVKQFIMRGMLMGLLPARLTADSFMHWMGFRPVPGMPEYQRVIDLFYLGVKHYQMPPETARIMPGPLPDDGLRSLQMPVLLLFGAGEVIYDPRKAIARAHCLIPNLQSDLLPGCSHDMCLTQHARVDARVMAFLNAA